MDFSIIKTTSNHQNTNHHSTGGHVATPNHQQHEPPNHFYKEYSPPPKYVSFHSHRDRSHPYEFEASSGSYQQRYHPRNGMYNDRNIDSDYREQFYPNSYSPHNSHSTYTDPHPIHRSHLTNLNTYNENTNNFRNGYQESDAKFENQINRMCSNLQSVFEDQLCNIKEDINAIKDITMKDSSENHIAPPKNDDHYKLTKSNVQHTHQESAKKDVITFTKPDAPEQPNEESEMELPNDFRRYVIFSAKRNRKHLRYI